MQKKKRKCPEEIKKEARRMPKSGGTGKAAKSGIPKGNPIKIEDSKKEGKFPRAILGVRRNSHSELEYAVEISSNDSKQSSIIVCKTKYLLSVCPLLLINYLESHIEINEENEKSLESLE
eukprot:TRINITY_DN3905_c0_g3_i1.p1 TRINITY_DN3905_c0_g3~~TRINITY_DN3905_c0_g3_i1.p1  ORF type:complete len:120 (-),score=33.22 TRINITY_DN3905_c0_g3_i1:97-456(-)